LLKLYASHFRLGAGGHDVSRIQAALFLTSRLIIDASELAQGRYGLSTARAVLDFKRPRHIINRSYQTAPDDIVGKMTIAALDSEVCEKERVVRGLRDRPPQLLGSVGIGGANNESDLANIGGLLWAAGYGPWGARRGGPTRVMADAAEWSAPGPLPLEAIFQGLSDFLRDNGVPLVNNLSPDSALLYELYAQAVAQTGSGHPMIVPVAGTLREAICNAAQANASGKCRQVYLDETHNADLTVPTSTHWCGIFAAWVWRQAGALVYFKRWNPNTPKQFAGIFRENPDQYLWHSSRLKELWPGDILVFSPTKG